MQDELEQAIEEALDGRPRAAALTELTEALRDRRDRLRSELRATDDADRCKDLRAKLRETDRQLDALQEEQAITEFVEMSVKAAVLRATPSPDPEHGMESSAETDPASEVDDDY